MRPVINSTFVSIDGVINHMDKWHFDYVDAESDALALEQLKEAGAKLMGTTPSLSTATSPARSGISSSSTAARS